MKLQASGIITRYFIKQVLLPFVVCTTGFLFLFLIADVQDDLGDFIKAKSSLETILTYFGLRQVQNFPLIAPIALQLACMYSFSAMSKNNEITALQASGTPIFQASIPLMFLGFFISIGSYFVSESLASQASSTTTEIRNQALKKSLYRHHSPTFRGEAYERSWDIHANAQGELKNTAVTIYRIVDNKKIRDRSINAKSATYKKGQGWTFHQATISHFSEQRDLRAAPSYKKELIEKDFSESLEQMTSLADDSISKSNTLIQSILNSELQLTPKARLSLQVQYYNQYFKPFACLIAIILGITFSITAKRQAVIIPIIKGIGVLVSYLVVDMLFRNAADAGYLPALAGGGLATVLYTFLSLFLLRQKDSLS